MYTISTATALSACSQKTLLDVIPEPLIVKPGEPDNGTDSYKDGNAKENPQEFVRTAQERSPEDDNKKAGNWCDISFYQKKKERYWKHFPV